MVWKARRASLAAREEALVEESAAFLNGTYLQSALGDGDVPSWLWLSALAHGDPAALTADDSWILSVGERRPELETWARVVRQLALDVSGLIEHTGCALVEVQREILVPLELAVMISPVGPATLYRLVGSVLDQARQRVDSEPT